MAITIPKIKSQAKNIYIKSINEKRPDVKILVGKELKNFRYSVNMSTGDFARLIGIPESSYIEFEQKPTETWVHRPLLELLYHNLGLFTDIDKIISIVTDKRVYINERTINRRARDL